MIKEIEEMKKKISAERFEELEKNANVNMVLSNQSPGVDQGGEYVYSSKTFELYLLLLKEIKRK